MSHMGVLKSSSDGISLLNARASVTQRYTVAQLLNECFVHTIPAGNYMFKVEICSKLTIKTSEER